jgi:NAD(P)-dependent dehydrogenase (short-subunit alcohol dehydrogenase family)
MSPSSTMQRGEDDMPGNEALGLGLADKGVIVTGAASGIGRAVAIRFVAAGAKVVALDRNSEGLDLLVAEIGDPARVFPAVVDLRRLGDAEQVVADAVAAVGNLYALVAAAAALKRQPLLEVTEEDWALQLDTNLRATFFLNRAAAEQMKRQGGGGRIINFTSGAWLSGPLFRSDAYVISKGGIVTLSRGFARQYGQYGILVNSISPGQVDTPMQHIDNEREMVDLAVAGCPLGRMGQPDEIAAVALFLASDHASFVSGATINVSGAAVMY